VLAVIGLITVKLIMAIVGALSGFVSLLFSLLPILLIGWLILKVIKHLGRDKKAAYD
jgi:uncharacterized membrane protein